MGDRAKRFTWRRPLIVLMCLLGSAALWWATGPVVRSWHVERAITRFEHSPSQAGADSLVSLLQSQAATTEQGERILTLLRQPIVTTRQAYPAESPVMIALERPFHLGFRDTLWRQEEIWTVEGQDRRSNSGQDAQIPWTVYLRGLNAYQAKPGVHQIRVRCTYSLGIQRRTRITKAGRYVSKALQVFRLPLGESWQPSRSYECEFEVPIQVTVVPPEEAETIELASSPSLDDAMRAAFRVRSSGFHNPHRTAAGKTGFDALKAICYQKLPMAVAFRLELHLSDGETPATRLEYPRQLRAKAGSSGAFPLRPWELEIKAPGTYTGSVMLTPDPNAAYEDPAIEAIWNGTMELPISFTISRTLNGP